MLMLRLAFRSLQAVSPSGAAALAERLFFTPPRARLTPEMRAELERGRPFTITVEGHRIAAWSWGREGRPVVYLVHGWGSRGGRLTAHVRPLEAAGYRVITFDGIGHGASEGARSSAPQLARALAALAEVAGEPYAIVAHSLGAVVATLVMEWGLPVSRAAFLAPNADPIPHTLGWARRMGLRPEVIARLREATERRIAFSWDDLDVVAMARRRTTPLLVIHDAQDEVVPWMEGAAIVGAWPGSRFVTTTGLGHSTLVRTPEVVAQVASFIGKPPQQPARTSGAVVRESHGIERELFDRERRTVWRPSSA